MGDNEKIRGCNEKNISRIFWTFKGRYRKKWKRHLAPPISNHIYDNHVETTPRCSSHTGLVYGLDFIINMFELVLQSFLHPTKNWISRTPEFN